ncbi:hypothetical protein AA101099_2991 [Neoasaia chiangmaiensis NBRC 101099]|uniref:Uncharacterized protein n=1 Tax=Neoasaia chiangmaiensis TaxID=320497 RepID=A0A1U9KNP3_9PROT|nr:hypothetical protein [Neoasaia chiangmaiensis]AQS87416.1 hypothetical protein A0U93_05090 [Neoasaia chiangmaiensis]GBR42800.1 hypothetical protein AA101099_2991 [Neoasaia chiangmaiensis NBRC 101099]GEN16188.1 hypothetical protein NCH01_26190 [Neoasaia chiangmaiensis]
MRRGLIGFALAIVTTGPALAENAAPLVTPLQDTDITYDIQAPDGHVLHQRMRWRSATWQQRIDPGDSATVMLTDYRAGRLQVVDLLHRTVTTMDVPLAQFAPPGVPAAGVWRKGNVEHVAGRDCTEWSGTDSEAQPGVFCYTTDGLLLGASRSGVHVVQAASIAQGPQAEAVFALPPGLKTLAPATPH